MSDTTNHETVSQSRRPRPRTFEQDTAEKTGRTVRSVQQTVQIARDIPEDVKDVLKAHEPRATMRALLALSRLPPDTQREAARRVAEGTPLRRALEAARSEKDRRAEWARAMRTMTLTMGGISNQIAETEGRRPHALDHALDCLAQAVDEWTRRPSP